VKLLTAGSAAGIPGLFANLASRAKTLVTQSYAAGVPPLKIKSVKAIAIEFLIFQGSVR
jgi:hypothetical protein